MRSGIVLVLMLAGSRAHAEPDDELDVPGLDATDLRGDALVWEDAAFHLEPWEGGATIRFASISRRLAEVGRAIPVRIVDASMRRFVEIALPRRSDCTWRRLESDPRLDAVRLFVKREDLAPVLVKPYTAHYSDGTRIKLAPGMPIVPTASGHYAVAVLGDRLRLRIPHASVGYIYKPGAADPPAPSGKLVSIDRATLARVGSDGFTVRSTWIAPVPATKSDPMRIPYATRCLELVAQIPAVILRSGSSYLRVQPIELQPPPVPRNVEFVIPRGAPLATPTGREVAVAATALEIADPGTGPACVDLTMKLVRDDEQYATQSRPLRLCAAREVVVRRE